MVLKAGRAINAVLLHAAPGLRANAHTIADFDVPHVVTNSHSFADNLVADDTSWAFVSQKPCNSGMLLTIRSRAPA